MCSSSEQQRFPSSLSLATELLWAWRYTLLVAPRVAQREQRSCSLAGIAIFPRICAPEWWHETRNCVDGVLSDCRQSVFSALGASYEILDLRTPWLRVVRMRSHGLVTDFGTLNRAIPFLHRLADRAKVSIVLSGEARFDSREGSRVLQVGDMASSASAAATEAHSGDLLGVEWNPRALGAAQGSRLDVRRLSHSDTCRIAELAKLLDGPMRFVAVLELLDSLRAQGLAIGPVCMADLMRSDREACQLQLLQNALSERLTALHEFPTLEEVSAKLSWDQRRVHRRLARLRETYGIVWLHWREFVHQARMLRAMQLLTVPTATTELVARLSGFRSPSALCHAFAKADLPSPGRFASIASVHGLAGRSDLAA